MKGKKNTSARRSLLCVLAIIVTRLYDTLIVYYRMIATRQNAAYSENADFASPTLYAISPSSHFRNASLPH